MTLESLYDSATNFLNRKRLAITDGDNNTLMFDATVSENHLDKSIYTRHPIESGSSISDHKIDEPLQLTVRSIQSNHPPSIVGSLITAGSSFVGNKIGGVGGALASFGGSKIGAELINRAGNDENKNRAQTAYQMLSDWKKNGIPLSISTGLIPYSSMVISELSSERKAKNAESLDVRIVFEELDFVETTAAAIPDDGIAHTAIKEKDGGALPSNATNGKTDKAAKNSFLKLGKDALKSRYDK